MTLTSTEFKNLSDGTSTFGFRLYDEYGKTYDNLLDKPIEGDVALLLYALDCGDPAVVTELKDNHTAWDGLTINGTWYDAIELDAVF